MAESKGYRTLTKIISKDAKKKKFSSRTIYKKWIYRPFNLNAKSWCLMAATYLSLFILTYFVFNDSIGYLPCYIMMVVLIICCLLSVKDAAVRNANITEYTLKSNAKITINCGFSENNMNYFAGLLDYALSHEATIAQETEEGGIEIINRCKSKREKEPKELSTYRRYGRVIGSHVIYNYDRIISHCEIELCLFYEDPDLMLAVATILNQLGMPRGSSVNGFGCSAKFGNCKCMVIFIQKSNEHLQEISDKLYGELNEIAGCSAVYENIKYWIMNLLCYDSAMVIEKAELILKENCKEGEWNIEQVA